jgi:hypothetical protein
MKIDFKNINNRANRCYAQIKNYHVEDYIVKKQKTHEQYIAHLKRKMFSLNTAFYSSTIECKEHYLNVVIHKLVDYNGGDTK